MNLLGQPSQKTQEIILKVWAKGENLRGTDTFLFLGCQDFTRLSVTFSLQIVSDAAGQGVAITGNNTFNNWNWPNAVIFAATVITTIGKYLLMSTFLAVVFCRLYCFCPLPFLCQGSHWIKSPWLELPKVCVHLQIHGGKPRVLALSPCVYRREKCAFPIRNGLKVLLGLAGVIPVPVIYALKFPNGKIPKQKRNKAFH